jgi:hypothetical protein
MAVAILQGRRRNNGMSEAANPQVAVLIDTYNYGHFIEVNHVIF